MDAVIFRAASANPDRYLGTFSTISELLAWERRRRRRTCSFLGEDTPWNHDLLLTRKDGPVRCFRVYDRPRPKSGDIITLPIDGQLVKAAVKGSPERPKMPALADAEAIEI